MKINGAQTIIECLKRENIEVVFGYPGGAVLTLYDALYTMKFPHILTRHEQGAVHAADGYARSSGKVGVCFATSGPGATNLITGIATAYMDSIPLVCITGQVGTGLIGKDSFQEADICGITTPITKHNYLVKNVDELPRVLKEAFFIARTGRPGPVVIDVAKDVFAAELDFVYPSKVKLKGYSGEFACDIEQVKAVVAELHKAERPVLFIGGGVVLSDTAAEVRDIANKLGIPVIASLMGLGAVASATELNLGMVGMHGSYAANMAAMECDLLIGLGVRFDDRVTGIVEEFAPQAKIIQFDIDPAEINKNVRVDLPVTADLRQSLPQFKQLLSEEYAKLAPQYANWCKHLLSLKLAVPLAYKDSANSIMPQQVIEAVNELVDDDAIIVTDVGQHQMWTAQFYKFLSARTFITSGGLGTMGYGLPAAIGAKLAQPKKTVILFSGDGSIMMNCQEFATAADYGIDVKVILLNNQTLGMISQWQRMFYGERYSESKLAGKTDHVKLAEAMGATGFRVRQKADLAQAIKAALAAPGPALVDILVSAAEDVLPMVPTGARLDEMLLGANL